MTCPHCASENTRPSKKESRIDLLNDRLGRVRYRCRDCRHSFYAKLPQAELQRLRESESIRKKRRRGWRGFVQNPTHRRALEVLVFFGMLVVFYIAFNSLISKDGSGVFSRPAAEAQP